MRWKDCRIVAFDTETTGLRPWDGDRVIEFGAVEIRVDADGRVADVQAHDFLCNPGIPIPRSASRVSSITDADVADQPPFADRADQVRAILGDAVVVAHNLPFDVGFIRAELGRAGRPWPITRAEVDTLRLAQRLLPELADHRLQTVCQALGVRLENAHRASHDAEACGRVFVELARQKGAPDDLDGMIEWADALGPPPDTGHLVMGSLGVPEFAFGPYRGQTVEQHPEYLQWMILALERRNGRWIRRFPDAVRSWARRWLRVRASGRGQVPSRSQGARGWNIDPPLGY